LVGEGVLQWYTVDVRQADVTLAASGKAGVTNYQEDVHNARRPRGNAPAIESSEM
tara:strand:+ start:328 stop:492 length:165 start_codon:yes stop_codon:yes gene_type:complete